MRPVRQIRGRYGTRAIEFCIQTFILSVIACVISLSPVPILIEMLQHQATPFILPVWRSLVSPNAESSTRLLILRQMAHTSSRTKSIWRYHHSLELRFKSKSGSLGLYFAAVLPLFPLLGLVYVSLVVSRMTHNTPRHPSLGLVAFSFRFSPFLSVARTNPSARR
ncbi:hypothetical protein C8F04DRAFT_514369 [Mycena alexandri]|uniref:Uncharacterized protein n=1 Tax=Mycena alexandri TaxID=1745969 RepID=A0AAD6X3T4_9AGAR|nr:hypothetical protein C8F04DRAFT_514369 [Mycena alexandri]